MEQTKAPETYISPVYEKFGKNSFRLTLTKHTNAGFGIVIVSFVAMAMKSHPFIAESSIGQSGLLGWGTIILFAFGVFSILTGIITSWFVYKSNTFAITEDALKIRRGILHKTEIAIPYRQIQDISLKRNLVQQIMGVSKIEILTAGEDNDNDLSDEAILDSLDKDKAERLQTELVHRANVQKFSQQKI